MSRLPEFDPRELDDAQKNVYNIIVSGPRGKFGGPFYALIHAPGLADATQALGKPMILEHVSGTGESAGV